MTSTTLVRWLFLFRHSANELGTLFLEFELRVAQTGGFFEILGGHSFLFFLLDHVELAIEFRNGLSCRFRQLLDLRACLLGRRRFVNRAACFLQVLTMAWKIEHFFTDVFQTEPQVHQHLGRDSFVFPHKAQQQMLRTLVFILAVYPPHQAVDHRLSGADIEFLASVLVAYESSCAASLALPDRLHE